MCSTPSTPCSAPSTLCSTPSTPCDQVDGDAVDISDSEDGPNDAVDDVVLKMMLLAACFFGHHALF